jgi:hypothetical protein
MYNKEVIREAYNVYIEKIKNPSVKATEDKAVQTITSLRERILSLDNFDDISFIHDYTFGSGPDAFAAPMSIDLPGIRDNLTQLLNKKGGKRKLRALFSLINEEKSRELLEKIEENSLYDFVDRSPDEFSPRPRLYSCRLELMLFPDLFTTVAYFPTIRSIAEKLGVYSSGMSFEEMQYSVRSCIDQFLEENNLRDTLTPFQVAALAWEIGEL